MTTTSDAAVAPVPYSTPIPRADGGLLFRLSIMMFLQYAIWGAWLSLIYVFLTRHRGLQPAQAGNLISIAAVGALAAPFIAGQIADRWFNTEKFLAISHLIGAALVWQLAKLETFGGLAVVALLYSLVYAPTLPLTNSLAFHHLPDRDRDFGKVRVWGTIGWIAAGIGFAQWLFYHYPPDRMFEGMADAFRLSAILGVIMGVYCFFLPPTPPRRDKQNFAAAEAMGEVSRSRALVMLFLISFPVSLIHQFYFVQTAPFLASLNLHDQPLINRIFGVGGGGLMTIGQMSEIAVLVAMPFVAKRVPRKTLLAVGLAAYIVRFFIFAYLPTPAAVIPALALHGICFGFFFFIAFMIVDEMTGKDVRASAQGLYNLVIIGIGIIVGNYFAGAVAQAVTRDGVTDFRRLFMIPMWIAIACLILLLIAYPKRSVVANPEGLAAN